MSRPHLAITHGQVALAGRCMAAVSALAFIPCYAQASVSPVLAAWLAAALMLSLLVAVPWARTSDIVGAAAIWITAAELLAPAASGEAHVMRWLVALAVGGALILCGKVQYWRKLARANPYAEFGSGSRRNRRLPRASRKSTVPLSALVVPRPPEP